MVLKFEAPNIPARKTSQEQTSEFLQGMPSLLLQYQALQRQKEVDKLNHELQVAQLNNQIKENQGKYGTGQPAPTAQPQIQPSPTSQLNLNPMGMAPTVMGMPMGTSGIGSTLGAGPDDSQPPVPLPETPEEELRRTGSEAYKVLHPSQYVALGPNGSMIELPAGSKPFSQPAPAPIYVIPTYDKDGNVVGVTPLAPGQKPFGGGKPPTPPKDPATTSEGIRRNALVEGGMLALSDIRKNMTQDVLTQLKAIRNDPFGAIEQMSSSPAKQVLLNLRTAIENQLYLKTGATATEDETRNAMKKFLAAAGDDLKDFDVRLGVLERDFGTFGGGKGAPTGGSKVVSSQADYDALAPGTEYTGPDGQTRRKGKK